MDEEVEVEESVVEEEVEVVDEDVVEVEVEVVELGRGVVEEEVEVDAGVDVEVVDSPLRIALNSSTRFRSESQR